MIQEAPHETRVLRSRRDFALVLLVAEFCPGEVLIIPGKSTDLLFYCKPGIYFVQDCRTQRNFKIKGVIADPKAPFFCPG